MSEIRRRGRFFIGWAFWLPVAFYFLSIVIIVYVFLAHLAETSEIVARQHAHDISRALTAFRTTYSRDVVGRLPAGATEVAHDYRDRDGAIPLPATLSIELAETLSRDGSGGNYRLVSAYPFPNRADRVLTRFEQEALAHFETGFTGDYSKTIEVDGGSALAYASPVMMEKSCLHCHNTRADSPRRDWQIGDVRGIQTVTVPLTARSILDSPGFVRTMAILSVGFGLAVFVIFVLVRRNLHEITETDLARRQAEENEARIRTVHDSTVDAIVTIDEDGVIESANPAVERIFGYPAEALTGRNVATLMPREEADQHDNYLRNYLATGVSGIIGVGREVIGKRADGSEFPLELSVSELDLGGKCMFTGILRDITARKNAEAKARRAETRLIEAIEALPDGFVLYDENDCLALCNTRYREIYKTSADVIQIGARFDDIIREGARLGQYISVGSNVEKWIAERLEAHRNPGEAVEQKLDNGRWVRIIERRTESGSIVGFRVDITELKEREEALRRSRELFKRTVTSALDAIVTIDEAGTIIEFNPAAETLFGFKRDEILGREMADAIVPERYRDGHRAGMQKYLKTGDGPVIGQKIEIEGLRSDGSEVMVELAIQEASGEDGRIFIGYVRDISAQKAGEQALLQAKERAEVATRAKAKFLAMMSHEIRTPLNGVLGILNLLEDTASDDEQRDLIHTASNSGKSLLAIINVILDFSKLEAGHMTLDRSGFFLADTVDGVRNLISPLAAEKGLELTTRIADDVSQAYFGDQGRIRQVLLNLASNAIKATHSGSIDIDVGATPADSGLVHLRFTVSDTGTGIAEDKHDLLFNEFTQLDAAGSGQFGGTGLGLAISRAIVDAMGGQIGFESELGSGSRFWFTVPLKTIDASVVGADRGAASSDGTLSSGLRILLAEDNATNRMVVTKMLEDLGCRVDIAENGQQAVDAVRSGSFDVVLMDIAMPELDGIEATRRIRDMPAPQCDLPIVALTAYAFVEDRARFEAAGMNAVVTKPVDRQDLVSGIARATAGSTETDSGPFDKSILDALMSGHSPEMQDRLMTQFLRDIRAQHDQLEESVANGDVDVAERASHVLKSVAGTFGAMRLADDAERTNSLIRNGKSDEALASVDELIDACRAVLQFQKNAAAERRRSQALTTE